MPLLLRDSGGTGVPPLRWAGSGVRSGGQEAGDRLEEFFTFIDPVRVTDVFAEELRDQLAQARLDLAAAREAGDEDGIDAYRGRITGLLRIAARHSITVPHEPDDDVGDED